MRDQDRIAEISKALQDDFVVSLRDGLDLFAILERRDTALLALVRQWREEAKNARDSGALEVQAARFAVRSCADQLERLITGEGK